MSSTLVDELDTVTDTLAEVVKAAEAPEIDAALDALVDSAANAGRAWSGSWLGYHASVYYADLEVPPAGAHFSVEWGSEETMFARGTTGNWHEWQGDEVRAAVFKAAGDPSLGPARELAARAQSVFKECHDSALSILEVYRGGRPDAFVEQLVKDVGKLEIPSSRDYLNSVRPAGELWSRDSLAATQGLRTPPHFLILGEIFELRSPPLACGLLADLTRRASGHFKRSQQSGGESRASGTNVFIGHGQSLLWKVFKDFVHDRLRLPWDEFNRTPVAGITNTGRLSEMMESAAIAFVIMTAEDEQSDGRLQARMNVIHEVGLFQGKLGFTKAIVLLEHGCEEFSNIQGLGQIRFPAGKIEGAFEDVRRVLEREGIIPE
jgi:CAP12/Pycsar effector protein, TIR domain